MARKFPETENLWRQKADRWLPRSGGGSRNWQPGGTKDLSGVDRSVLNLDCGDDCTIYIFSITDLYASNGWILRYMHHTSKKLLKENYNGWIHSDYTETHKSTGRNKSTNFLFWKLVTKRNEKKRITHFSCLSCANYQIALLDREETYYTQKNSSWCDRMIELENHHFTILMK